MHINKKKVAPFIIRWTLTTIVAFIVLFPLYWILISSITPSEMLFKSPIQYLPKAPTLDNYVGLFVNLNIGAKTINTIIVTFFSLIASTIFCLAGAYAFARFNSKGLSLAFLSLIFSGLIPEIVVARPLYDFLKKVHLVDTYTGLITLYTSMLIPFTLLIFYNFMNQIPISIEEAADIDGATFAQKIFYVVLPLMRPAVATIGIINFITCLNNLFIPLYYSRKIEVLSVGITTVPRVSSYQVPWDKISTMGWYIILPIIIFVLIFEKNIMEGIMAGGVKQ